MVVLWLKYGNFCKIPFFIFFPYSSPTLPLAPSDHCTLFNKFSNLHNYWINCKSRHRKIYLDKIISAVLISIIMYSSKIAFCGNWKSILHPIQSFSVAWVFCKLEQSYFETKTIDKYWRKAINVLFFIPTAILKSIFWLSFPLWKFQIRTLNEIEI